MGAVVEHCCSGERTRQEATPVAASREPARSSACRSSAAAALHLRRLSTSTLTTIAVPAGGMDEDKGRPSRVASIEPRPPEMQISVLKQQRLQQPFETRVDGDGDNAGATGEVSEDQCLFPGGQGSLLSDCDNAGGAADAPEGHICFPGGQDSLLSLRGRLHSSSLTPTSRLSSAQDPFAPYGPHGWDETTSTASTDILSMQSTSEPLRPMAALRCSSKESPNGLDFLAAGDKELKKQRPHSRRDKTSRATRRAKTSRSPHPGVSVIKE